MENLKKRIEKIAEKNDISMRAFESKCGLNRGNLSNMKDDGTIGVDKVSKILDASPEISPDWLLTGRGPMLRTETETKAHKAQRSTSGIPLVSENAVAGFGNADFGISEQDVKDYYVIPKFKFLSIDFMIEIHGSSMYPKYNSGDIVACTILRDRKFIQWNKCHIIASREQGILCKRLRQSEKKNYLTAVSDNKDYPPFDIPESDITGIALVVGVIRLE